MQTQFQNRLGWSVLAAASLLSITLTACGGGSSSDSDLPCGGTATLRLGITYNVNGTVVEPDQTVVLQRNQPVLATPQIVGLPTACATAARLSVNVQSRDVPAGLVVNPESGVISGTSTERGSFSVRLTVNVDGYVSSIQQTIRFII